MIDQRLAVSIPDGVAKDSIDFVLSALSNNGYFCEDKDVNFMAIDHQYGTAIIAYVDYYIVLTKSKLTAEGLK